MLDCTDYQIKAGRPDEAGITPEILNKMHLLRAEIFNGRNQWGLPVSEGIEKDSFDTDETIYVICVRPSTNNVVACWRMLPTTRDYMLNTVFTDLLPGSLTISDPKIWELSRFAIKKGFKTNSPMLASDITRDMFSAIRKLSFQMGIVRFVTVMSPSLYRLLSNSGLTMPRIDTKSDKERRRLGRTSCFIDIDERFHYFVGAETQCAVLQHPQ